MSNNNLDSSIQTTSCSVNLTPNNSINKKQTDEVKKKRSPYQTQKEIFMKRKDMIDSMHDVPKSLSPKRRRKINFQIDDKYGIDLSVSGLNVNKKKKVTFKGNFVQVIKVVSYKRYYIEGSKSDETVRCNCFIF